MHICQHMRGSLWGPPVWQMMFACSWHVNARTVDALRELLTEQLPFLLPCKQCRDNYNGHIVNVNRRIRRLATSDDFMRWCYYLKDEVNKTTHRSSIPLTEVIDRYVLHGPCVSEVHLADTLMLIALSARSLQRDDIFISFCHNLSLLLPSPSDSALRTALQLVSRPIVNSALRCARNTRLQHGLRPLVMAHYRAVAE